MSIPLYFAICEQEYSAAERFPFAQCGFGFHEDGSPRLPERIVPNALCVIDDAVLPPVGLLTAQSVDALAACCSGGCVFDFEREEAAAHRFIVQLAASLPRSARIVLPVRYRHLLPDATPIVSCPAPVNRWQAFLAQTQKNTAAWMLELVPWAQTYRFCCALQADRLLPQAMAHCNVQGNEVRYRETAQTIQERVTQAEAYGCIGVIGLYSELKPFFSEV